MSGHTDAPKKINIILNWKNVDTHTEHRQYKNGKKATGDNYSFILNKVVDV